MIDRSLHAVNLCQQLIRFESINPPGCEREAAQFCAEILANLGFEVHLVEHGSQRASVLAVMRGSGERPGLLCTGHLDVVPALPEEWSKDPFAGEVSDGKIWGRGASDMKGGIAAIISAAGSIAAQGAKLKGDLLLAFTAGEETDCLGSGEIVRQFDLRPVQGIIVAEPTENEVLIAEKGALWLEITTIGKAAHTSRIEEGRNAILMMAEILAGLSSQYLPAESHPLTGRFQRSINTIQGGNKTNTIPSCCTITLDQRTIPGQSHKELLKGVEKVIGEVKRVTSLPDFQASVKVLLDNPPLMISADDPFIQNMYQIVEQVTGQPQCPKGVGYFTDAVKFAPALNAPFVICGPGNPRLNHQADEWLDVEKLEESVQIYKQAATRLLI